MTVTWETAAVGLIVGAALVWAGRSAWRAGRRKQVCSTCGSAGACPLVNGAPAAAGPGATCPAAPGSPPECGPEAARGSSSDPAIP